MGWIYDEAHEQIRSLLDNQTICFFCRRRVHCADSIEWIGVAGWVHSQCLTSYRVAQRLRMRRRNLRRALLIIVPLILGFLIGQWFIHTRFRWSTFLAPMGFASSAAAPSPSKVVSVMSFHGAKANSTSISLLRLVA